MSNYFYALNTELSFGVSFLCFRCVDHCVCNYFIYLPRAACVCVAIVWIIAFGIPHCRLPYYFDCSPGIFSVCFLFYLLTACGVLDDRVINILHSTHLTHPHTYRSCTWNSSCHHTDTPIISHIFSILTFVILLTFVWLFVLKLHEEHKISHIRMQVLRETTVSSNNKNYIRTSWYAYGVQTA